MQRRRGGGAGRGRGRGGARNGKAKAAAAVAFVAKNDKNDEGETGHPQHERLVKQHFVALQALEQLASENERLHDEIEAANGLRGKVADLETIRQQTEVRHTAKIKELATAAEVAAKQAKLASDVATANQLAEAAAEHKSALETQNQEYEALRTAVRLPLALGGFVSSSNGQRLPQRNSCALSPVRCC